MGAQGTVSTAPIHNVKAPGYDIQRISGALLEPAAKRLVASASAGKDAATSFLEAAGTMGIDLKGFWGSIEVIGGCAVVREVALVVPGSGGAVMLFTSAPSGSAAEAELGAVINRACDASKESGLSKMAQALLLPRERAAGRALEAAGFTAIAELAYMRRPMELPASHGLEDVPDMPHDITMRVVADLPGGYRQSQARLVSAMERSYEGTLDCPELCAMRTAQDALESHRESGLFDPSLWWLIEHKEIPAGVMLFTPSSAQDGVELVYVGLAPELRGRGIGRTVLRFGLESVCLEVGEWVTCAVDLRNTPARKLYARTGFRRFGLRKAMVRALA